MADFCRQCTLETFPEVNYDAHGDLVGLCPEGETVVVLCEGCGWTMPVDSRGECQIHGECIAERRKGMNDVRN